MDGKFTVELFDLLTYLLPGLIVIAAISVMFGKRILHFVPKETTMKVLSGFLCAFFFGVLTHVVITNIFSLSIVATKMSLTNRHLEGFKEIAEVKLRLEKKIGIISQDNGSIYRYAETFVIENGDAQAASISRLLALSLFCRNSVLPIFLVGCSLIYTSRRKKISFIVLLIGLTICVELILIRGFINYYSAAMSKVLRTFLVLTA